MKNIDIVGVACDIAGAAQGPSQSPQCLKDSPYLNALQADFHWHWIECAKGVPQHLAALEAVVDYSQKTAKLTRNFTQKEAPFIVLGGDHSCAIGTWSGVSQALHEKKAKAELGLIWVDAHLDAHTPETSESGNIHGMPVAHLLGHGEPRLCHLLENRPQLNPKHLALIGIRSYEPPELTLIQQLGIRVYDMETVNQRGIQAVLQEAYDHVMTGATHFGLSVDIDGLDPEALPAVCTPVADGIKPAAFLNALKHLDKSRLVALEIAEFCPRLDTEQRSEKFIVELINTLFL